ncbi:MAG: DUF917 family protein [Desulfobacteraceae bacterium]|nr:DUF917 family protein [Desulfobacteraceae bacterium]
MQEQASSKIVNYSYTDLYDFIEGATFLATGGGGPKDVAHYFLKESGVSLVNVITSPFVSDDMQIACAAEVFAPSAIETKRDFLPALKSYEGLINPEPGKNTGVLPGEVGAINGIVPAIVAGLTGSCLIADTQTDRATSEMDMGLFQNKVPYCYLNMLNDDGQPVLQKEYSSSAVDAMVVETDVIGAMKAHPELKGVGGFATYPMTGLDLKRYYDRNLLLPNTFEYARLLGSYMREPDFENLIFKAIQTRIGSQYSPYRMFKGRLVAARQVEGNQDYGMADFMSSDPKSCLGARVYYSNENMIAYYLLWVLVRCVPTPIQLGPMAIGPDAICYLLTSAKYLDGYSFTNEAFTDDYGDPDFFKTHEIEIMGIPEPSLRRPDLINNFKREIKATMGAFGGGYDGPYIPIEQLQGAQVGFDMPKKKGEPGGDSHLILSSPVEGAIIRYTLDGSAPDRNSDIYKESIPYSVVAGNLVRASLFHGGKLSGITVSANFSKI